MDTSSASTLLLSSEESAGAVSACAHFALIDKSHRRCAANGLLESDIADFTPLNPADLACLIERNRGLLLRARPVMETLYEQIADTRSIVVLTDGDGVIVHALGDDDFLAHASRAAQPGVSWSEQGKGTNAVGTAIVEQTPLWVHAEEHYLAVNRFFTCSAAPIFDHCGSVIGVLDVSGDLNSFHQHTMALVRMSAQMIENQIFAAAYQDAVTLHFHSRPEFIGTLMEGIASFTPGGRFLAANRSGLALLGLPRSALQNHTVSSLFGLPMSALFDHCRTAAQGLLNLPLHDGARVHARVRVRLTHDHFRRANEALAEPACAGKAVLLAQHGQQQAPRRMSSLHYLNTGDAQIAALIDKVNKVIGRDIAILVMGETGTGKELLAQAIHNDSPRADGPFVAVNCASIPETLIESELFGYEDGAFTGARKKGNVGKLLQANGGTLFLDEIGDMPLNLQARLLRVLQERMVTPLGSSKSIPVNVALICATHRNLRELIAANVFREDLYYRLNGLVVKLPPLRERTDIEAVINRLIAAESEGMPCTVSAEVMALFRQHSWPGNCRQLINLLRTALIMVGDEREVRREHLPDDFLEDMQAAHRPASPALEAALPPAATLDDMEMSVIQKALAAHGGNVSAAARALGVSRNKIYRKLAPQ